MPDENTVGREPITIVEIDQDFCNNTYGSAPCTASVGTTGDFKCYNTLTTCQDTANYDKGSLTLRFCSKTSSFPTPSESELYIPIVESVSTNPTEVNINSANDDLKSLGRRASVTIVMSDIPYDDARVDSYLSDRTFDPLSRSTFWVKWLARNEFYQNRPLRVREGYVGESVGSMRTRNYIIDRIEAGDSSGRIRIVAKDILKLADNKRALAPPPTTGVLLSDITDTDTVIEINTSSEDEYPSGEVVLRIGNELILAVKSFPANQFNVVTDVSMNPVGRGYSGSTASSHEEGDSVQLCIEYEDERVEAIIEDLLEDYADIDSSFINTSEWSAEADEWLSGSIYNTIISEPTGVEDLIGELIQQSGAYIWWDDVNQEIRFRAVKPFTRETITTITEDANIIEDSFRVQVRPKERLSRVLLYYAILDYTDDLTDPGNFKVLLVNADTAKESADEYGEIKQKIIYSRWLSEQNAGEALFTTGKVLTLSKINPRYYWFDTDAKDRALDIGDVAEVTHRALVDSQGGTVATRMQVISREEIEPGHKVRYKCQRFGYAGRYGFIMANSANDFGSATDTEKAEGAYICDNNGFMSDNSEGYKII